MSVLHKKSRQSLRPSIERIGWDFFSKIGILWGTYFVKKVPNFEIVWSAPATPRALNIKAVYVASHSWYGEIIDSVCISIFKKFTVLIFFKYRSILCFTMKFLNPYICLFIYAYSFYVVEACSALRREPFKKWFIHFEISLDILEKLDFRIS